MKIKLIMPKITIISLLILCLEACTSGHNSYSDFRNLPDEGWAYNDTLQFTPLSNDSITTGKIAIALRHNNNYNYSNVWLEIKHNINDSTTKSDTLNIELADIYGKWYGNGIGSSFQIEKELPATITINGSTPIIVRHIMRVDTLQNIEQIGLFFHSQK